MNNNVNRFTYEPSSSRFNRLKQLVGRPISDGFNIDDIHWVNTRIGITDYEGCSEAVIRGYTVINVAGELDSSAQIQADVNPDKGPVRDTLDGLAALINKILTESDEAKVVVHCAMGMERSPLTVVWYLHKYQEKTLEEAYQIVQAARESTVDRRNWID